MKAYEQQRSSSGYEIGEKNILRKAVLMKATQMRENLLDDEQ